ncbi:hypothetical protein MELA_02336 [Candidatus Methylomirabilis lanthanidiphila]|uniref:Transglycosylase SLT domain-containing protein n=1 Tax=Candidatus Methylomirabilis lanthanidiphila TaxID=2211376 RepID=A0A564ZMR6_9BACT|nr:hypothetical protein MELA_02336 [Candidatus Methylomirabilis lanthanidiphila]
MGYCDVWGGGCFRIVGAAVLLLGILTPSYDVSAQPIILEKIKEAQNRLDGLELNHHVTTIQQAVPVARRSKGQGRKPAFRYVKLQALTRDVAVTGLNLKTGESKDFIFEETVLLEPKKRPHVKPPQVIANENNCELTWRGGSRWGFNRDLLLTCNGEDFAVINLTMWTSRTARSVVVDQKTGRRMCRQGPLEQILGSYVPYSLELHTPDVADAGRRYLERVILQALQDLDDLNVTSKTFTDENLSGLTSIDFIHALLVDEHMDPEEFIKHQKNGSLSRLIEKYWVEVAINQDSAFRMSVSPAGATGISQFICPTYARILDESPESGLDPGFVHGMRDHVNAVKASIILFDADMSSWWTPTVKKVCAVSTEMLEDCWAASYNGGPNRLNRVVTKRGKHWMEKDTTVRNTRRYFASRLKEETYTYLAKLRSIRGYLLALEKSTPSTTDP